MLLFYQLEETDELADAVFKYGFLEVLPATTLMGPGTLLVVEKQSGKYVMVREVCAMDPAKISPKWEKSGSWDIEKQLNRKFLVTSSVRDGFGFRGHASEHSTVRIQNTQVLNLSYETMLDFQNEYLNGKCLDAVVDLVSKKKCVVQPYSELQADVLSTENLHDNIASDEQKRTPFPVELDISGTSGSSGSNSGKGLFIGMKLDSSCIVPNDGRHDGDGKTVKDLLQPNVQYAKR